MTEPAVAHMRPVPRAFLEMVRIDVIVYMIVCLQCKLTRVSSFV